MPLSSELVQAHFSAEQAKAINGGFNNTVSAAGTGQSDATLLKVTNSMVTTVAAGSGVIVPAVPPGDSLWIYNGATNALTIYPDVGAKINQLAANIGMLLSPYTEVTLRRVSTTQWIGNLSA